MYEVLLPIDTDIDRALTQARFVGSLPDAAGSINVTIVHSWTGRTDHVPEESVATQTATHVGSVQNVMDYFENQGIEFELIDGAGEPAELILDVANDINPDLIVMGGRKRTPVGKAISGSVTQSVLLETDLPVTVTGKNPK